MTSKTLRRQSKYAILVGLPVILIQWVQAAAILHPRQALPTGGDLDIPQLQQDLLTMTNNFRGGSRPKLCLQAELTAAAMAHASDMAGRGRLGHDGSNRSEPEQRAAAANFPGTYVGEIVLHTSKLHKPQEAFEGWKGSDSHRPIMLKPQANAVGIGVADGQCERDRSMTCTYWVQVFGNMAQGQCSTQGATESGGRSETMQARGQGSDLPWAAWQQNPTRDGSQSIFPGAPNSNDGRTFADWHQVASRPSDDDDDPVNNYHNYQRFHLGLHGNNHDIDLHDMPEDLRKMIREYFGRDFHVYH